MIRENKWKIFVTSVAIVLPILVGVLLWDELPEQMPTHWGFDGTVDGWSSRPFAVFALPLFILAVHWICIFGTAMDPKNKGQNGKMFALVLWITPIVSLIASGMMYAAALGKEVQPRLAVSLLLGVTFILIGNYLPKCKQNHTIGIKVKWTLESEENWNATHRFGGKVWVIGGLALIAGVLLPEVIAPAVTLVCTAVLVLLPIVYSYRYHAKQTGEA